MSLSDGAVVLEEEAVVFAGWSLFVFAWNPNALPGNIRAAASAEPAINFRNRFIQILLIFVFSFSFPTTRRASTRPRSPMLFAERDSDAGGIKEVIGLTARSRFVKVTIAK